MSDMRVSISWTPDQMQEVLAALEAGAEPQLDSHIVSAIRAVGERTPTAREVDLYCIEVTLQEGQLLKRWCDTRREHATEERPNAVWTRIVAQINEAVQLAAPAKPDRQER
jgi:hypothetical protein